MQLLATDPLQMVRAIPTTSGDRIYCKILAHNAVHAAFAGAAQPPALLDDCCAVFCMPKRALGSQVM
jgi:hypothetical protein